MEYQWGVYVNDPVGGWRLMYGGLPLNFNTARHIYRHVIGADYDRLEKWIRLPTDCYLLAPVPSDWVR